MTASLGWVLIFSTWNQIKLGSWFLKATKYSFIDGESSQPGNDFNDVANGAENGLGDWESIADR